MHAKRASSPQKEIRIRMFTSGSFVSASTISSASVIEAAKCRGVMPPGPIEFGGKRYFFSASPKPDT
ncbi:hypothetical protein SDJN02_12884 [Cucurbita argyrosperma subsp. argyrosperma]|nr:hypothetical protein SDJN02_12884 [Cucurbita argyrosperma subsp. argyrosperma]